MEAACRDLVWIVHHVYTCRYVRSIWIEESWVSQRKEVKICWKVVSVYSLSIRYGREVCVCSVGGIGICYQSAQPTQLGLHSFAVFISLSLSLSLSNQSCKSDPLHCSTTLIPCKLHTGTIMISPILPIYLFISSFLSIIYFSSKT